MTVVDSEAGICRTIDAPPADQLSKMVPAQPSVPLEVNDAAAT
jgi:hypothetical protein